MFVAFSAKEAHHFVYHQHEEVKLCDARSGEHHFHGQDYIHDNCTLCDFTFSVFELHFAQQLAFSKPQILILSQTFFYPSFFSFKPTAFAPLRGPPVNA